MPAQTDHLATTSRRGYRTIIEALDELVALEPDRQYASLPKSNNLDEGFEDVCVQQVGHAVDAFAHWLLNWCGGSRDDFETIGYMGANDLRYSVVLMGAIKCGKKAMFLSPHNTVEQNCKLIETTGCTKFLYSQELEAKVNALNKTGAELTTAELKPFYEWVASYTHSFVFDKSYEAAKWDPILVLHSSGSTGDPKAITFSNGFVAANLERALPEVPGRSAPGHRVFDFEDGGKFLAPVPPYHVTGLMSQAYYPLFSQKCSTVLGPPTRMTMPADIKKLLDMHSPRILFIAPFFIEAITQMPGGFEALTALDYVMFSGGPLAPEIGDRLAQRVHVVSFYGSCENGQAPFIMPRPEDWGWLEFHPSYRPTMEPYDGETYELVLHRTGDAAVDEIRGTFWTMPDEQEYRTKDLFVKHPSKEGLWRFYGRKDDTLIIGNGEKANPVPAETVLLGCPGVSGCLVVCNQRGKVAAMAEAREGEDHVEVAKALQAYIEKANACLPMGAQIQGASVIDSGSLVRAPKGTVVRKQSETKLCADIEALFGKML